MMSLSPLKAGPTTQTMSNQSTVGDVHHLPPFQSVDIFGNLFLGLPRSSSIFALGSTLSRKGRIPF